MRRCRPWLGTFVEIACDDLEAMEAGFAAVATVHRLMSAHDPASDLSRLNRRGAARPVRLHPWTAAVLARALFWAEASEGAFDPTVGGRVQAAGLIPRHPGQPAPDPRADWRDVRLDGRTARLMRPCVLDLGGIAKGFAVDQAVAALHAAGARRGLVNAGGDLRAFGEAHWPIVVAEPSRRRRAAGFRVLEQAVATSAAPRGRGGSAHLPRRARGLAGATVVGPSAMDADALTKVVLAGAAAAGECLAAGRSHAFRLRRDGAWERLA